MDYRRRRIALGLGVLALVGVTAERPSFGVHVASESAATPPRFEAAVKLGLAGVSVLLTWGVERLR